MGKDAGKLHNLFRVPATKKWNLDSNLGWHQSLALYHTVFISLYTVYCIYCFYFPVYCFSKSSWKLITTGCKNTYYHCYKWFLELLIEHLSTNINSRKPAAIARVAMIPANCIFKAANLTNEESKGTWGSCLILEILSIYTALQLNNSMQNSYSICCLKKKNF